MLLMLFSQTWWQCFHIKRHSFPSILEPVKSAFVKNNRLLRYIQRLKKKGNSFFCFGNCLRRGRRGRGETGSNWRLFWMQQIFSFADYLSTRNVVVLTLSGSVQTNSLQVIWHLSHFSFFFYIHFNYLFLFFLSLLSFLHRRSIWNHNTNCSRKDKQGSFTVDSSIYALESRQYPIS